MKDQMEKLITQMVEDGVFFIDAVSEFERRYIHRVLERNHGNQSRSAKALGIHRNTLGRKMEAYKLTSGNGHLRAKNTPDRRKKTKTA